MKKEKRISVQTFVCGLAVLLPGLVSGQQDTMHAKNLNPLVVSATRSPQDPDSIGRSITVITADQLQNKVYNNLSDVLSEQENIFVPGNNLNPGMAQSIFMRGANSNQTVIMIDGVRLSDPSSTNNALDLSEVSLLDIGQIEIVRGAHSTMYGSSAIGGVINIITRTSDKKGISGNAAVTAGNFGKETYTLSENVFVNYLLGNGIFVNAEILGMNINGLDATIDTVTDPKVFKNNDNDDYSKMEFCSKIGYRGKRGDAYVAYRKLNQDADLDKRAFTNDDNYILNFKRQLLSFGGDYKLNSKIRFDLDGGFTAMRRFAQDDSSIVDTAGTYDHAYADNTYQGTALTGDLQAVYQGKGFEMVAGTGLFDETMNAQSYVYSNSWGYLYENRTDLDTLNIDVLTTYAYVHAGLNGDLLSRKLKAFKLALGGRYTNHERFESNYTFEINPSLRIAKDALLYGTYATGFNAPSLYQLYTPEKDPVSGIQRGNRYLKPETSRSYEVGIKYFPLRNCAITASYFYNQTRNSIEWVYLWNKTAPVDSLTFFDYLGDTYLNLGIQTTHGVELSIAADLSKQFSLSANIAVLGGKLEYEPSAIDTIKTKGSQVQLYNNGQFLTGNKTVEVIGLTRRPSLANMALTYRACDRLQFRADVKYVGAYSDVYYNSELGPFGALASMALQDYALLGFNVKYKIAREMDLSLRADNILNKKYTEINGFTSRGRGVYMSMRFNF